MVTPEDFRRLALSIPEVIESAHMGHPDFRLRGKVIASLGYPDDGHAMVKLTPEQQREYLSQAPRAFTPSAGAWGRGGCTAVHLASAEVPAVRTALLAAAANLTTPKQRAR